MVEILPDSGDNVLAVRGSDRLTRRDYEELLIPSLEAILREHGKARFLFDMDADFKGWYLDAALKYAKFGFRHRDKFEKVAAVCGPKWVQWGMRLTSYLVNGEVKTFACDQRPEALQWITS